MRAPKQGIIYQEKLIAPRHFVRFSTPADVALYRAERLKCNTLLEIGSGIGGQTIAFSKTCKKVIAVEMNPEQAEILTKNLAILGIKNVEVIADDAMKDSTVKQIKGFKPDIIFCDTERAESGERGIDGLKPDLRKFLEVYGKITDKIAMEIPPFTNDLDRLKEDFEKEFISLYGELNRLTLYFNGLKKASTSAIALPSKTKIENKNAKKVELANSAGEFSYLYTIDPALFMAGLINELASQFKVQLIEMNKKSYLLSKEKIESDFLDGYKILAVCENKFEDILSELKKLDAKSVVLRYSVPPKEYWNERKRYESQLKGTRKVHLFVNREAVLCESLSY